MQIVILGAGVVGFQIAKNLISEGKDVVLIEKNPTRAKFVSNHLDCIVLNEEGTNIPTLRRAGLSKADFFISVTNSDEVNMIACGIVKSEFNVPVKIARVRNLDYSRAKILDKTFLGIDFIVNSEVETSKAIANTVEHGAASNVLIFKNSDMQMRNIFIDKKSIMLNNAIKELRSAVQEEFLVSLIIRDGEVIIPSGDTIIKENDIVYILARKDNYRKILKQSGKSVQKIDKIVIVGGGRIGRLVVRDLVDRNKKITLIDNNYDNCKELSELFPEALIIHGDISDEGIFEEEQLYNYDLIITATDNQELNILTAVYAKSLGTKRAVSLVAKSNYLNIANNLGIDATISPKISTVDAILKFVRKGNINSVHSLFEGKAEVIEFLVDEKNPISDIPIKDLDLPENFLILSVIRNNEDFLPGGNFKIQTGDSIITIVKKESIPKVEEFISG